MKIDFHVHTKESPCSKMPIEVALEKAKEAGLDAIAVVNHNVKPLVYKGKSKVKIIPGVEVSTKEGHLLVINTNKTFTRGSPAQEVIDKAGKDALIIVAHPFDWTRKGMLWRINKLKGYHGVEINSRCLLDRFNDKARLFAKKNHKILIAGTDSHSPEEIGLAYTEVKAKTIKEAISNIKKGDCTPVLIKRPLKQKIKPFARSIIKG